MNVMIVIEKLLASEGASRVAEKMTNNLIDIKKSSGYNLEAFMGVIKRELNRI